MAWVSKLPRPALIRPRAGSLGSAAPAVRPAPAGAGSPAPGQQMLLQLGRRHADLRRRGGRRAVPGKCPRACARTAAPPAPRAWPGRRPGCRSTCAEQMLHQILGHRQRVLQPLLECLGAFRRNQGVRIVAIGQEHELELTPVARQRQRILQCAPGGLAAGAVAVEAKHHLAGQRGRSCCRCSWVVAVPSVATA